MSITIAFPLGYKPVIKHGDHDQTDHGAWATQGSEKEKEIHERITDVKTGNYERDKYDEEDKNLYQNIEAKYKTKDNKTYLLSQENIKTPDGNNIIEVRAYEPKTLASGKEGRKQIGSLATEGRDSSIIDGVYVDEEYQRQGIATAMLNMARTYAPDNMKISHSFSLTDDAKGWSSVVKHGEHDQSSHGSWATGNFDEEGLSENVGNAYNERYGVDNAGNMVGVSNEEHSAIDDYSQSGYKRINSYLRETDKKTELDPAEAKSIIENDEKLYLQAIDEYSENNEVGEQLTESELEDAVYTYATKHGAELLDRANSGQTWAAQRTQKDVEALDKLISEAPELYTDAKGMPQKIFGDKNLYRAFSDKVLENLQEGDTFQDKGFLSTTRVDITQEEQGETRSWMGGINPSKDTVAVILPNETKSGKGLAVDMYRTAVQDTSSISDDEKEVLLPRNTPLKFLGYKTDVGTEARVAVFQRMDK
jgi:GNAT superfamily N-acetyltransferase